MLVGGARPDHVEGSARRRCSCRRAQALWLDLDGDGTAELATTWMHISEDPEVVLIADEHGRVQVGTPTRVPEPLLSGGQQTGRSAAVDAARGNSNMRGVGWYGRGAGEEGAALVLSRGRVVAGGKATGPGRG